MNVFRVFIYSLLKANHMDKKWRGRLIKRGTFITSVQKMAKESRLSTQQIRTALNKLKSTGELTIITTSKYSLIKVNKYDLYQENNKPNNKPSTNHQQTNNKPITTTKNDKNDKNDKNEELYAASEKISPADINSLMNIFYNKINPQINYANQTQRDALEWLVKKYGYDKTKKFTEYAISAQGQEYAPTITNPYELKNKLASLLVFFKRQKTPKYTRISI